MVTMEAVVAAVSVATVAAAAAGAFGGSFLGQNLDMCQSQYIKIQFQVWHLSRVYI